ncbi:MAG: DNA adenine methylase [Oscillospiraceae bacterium]|nr:DNA adenine methylase [Oscillospiraceae bacterium]
MKSFIPWMGGKSLLAKKITELFPDNFDRYIEVFGGGGSVLFYKENHAKLEVYNDLNSHLVNLFRCAKYHRTELQREISGYFNSREIFENIKEKLKIGGFTDIQRAAMFYVQIKISYGSDTRSYGCNNRSLSPDYLEKVEKRLERVVIENKDFENLIKVYDRSNALFYCDPPYFKTEKYYDAEFLKSDHERLKSCLDNIKGKFILSYNDDKFIRNLYQDYEIIPVERQNNLSKGSYKELIIKNL